MTDTAERMRVGKGILALALALVPIPASSADPQLWVERTAFHAKLKDLVEIGTDGAQLGALVDLFDFALVPLGYQYAIGGKGDVEIYKPDGTDKIFSAPTPAAALLAAMEEV